MLEPNGNVRAAPSRWWRAADVLLVLGGGRAGRCVVQTCGTILHDHPPALRSISEH